MKKTFSSTILLLTLSFIVSCKEDKNHELTEKEYKLPTLKEAFKSKFTIGTALNSHQIYGHDSLATQLIKREFNTVTPENVMKSVNIHPGVNTYNFDAADKYVQFGQDNDMFIVGHTLVWHSQLSNFFNEIEDKDSLKLALKKHVVTVAGRYAGKINGWDVVNEALNEDGSLRNSLFLNKLGDNYLVDAFNWAKQAAPQTELYYNDYNLCVPSKREGAIKLIKFLQENNCQVDGIGMQGHWGLETPTLEEIEKSIIAYSELGIKVMITELDITVLPNPWDLEGADVNQNFEQDPKMNPYPNGMPDSVVTKFNKRYKDIFELFLKHQDKIGRVTFWGVQDGDSWLNNWPIEGRTNYPLLFDRDYKQKPAYKEVIQVAAKN